MNKKYTILAGLLALSFAAVVLAKDEGKSGPFPSEGLSGVVLNAGGGKIVVEGVAGGAVETSPLEASGVCLVTGKVSGAVLSLTKHKDDTGAISNCRIKIPAKLSLEVKMGGGSLEVRDMAGAVSIAKTAGEGHLSGLSGAVKIKMTAGSMSGNIDPSSLEITGTTGKVSLEGLGCGVSVDRVAGGLNLAWAKGPSSEVKVKSSGGKVVLSFPADARIRTDLKTKEKGVIHDDFSGGAGTLVSVHLAGGSVDVLKAAKVK